MQPTNPPVGLVLVHHASQDSLVDGLTGSLEAWGQWGSGGDFEACHVEGIYDATRIAKMNPSASCLYDLATAPWAHIVQLRLDLSRFYQYGVPQFPDMDPIFCKNFQLECDEHLGERYAWGQIFRFSGIGILARFWPSKAQEILKSKNADALAQGHEHVCSQWLTDRIENTVIKTYGFLDPIIAAYDLFEGAGVGDGEERPADYVKSQDLKPF